MSVQMTEMRRTMRIVLMDNWHPRWLEVLDAIEHIGLRHTLRIDSEGWLSARQNLMVAFCGDAVAGHICFRVEPMESIDHPDRPRIEARLDSLGVQPGFEHEGVERALVVLAEKRARALGCQRLIG